MVSGGLPIPPLPPTPSFPLPCAVFINDKDNKAPTASRKDDHDDKRDDDRRDRRDDEKHNDWRDGRDDRDGREVKRGWIEWQIDEAVEELRRYMANDGRRRDNGVRDAVGARNWRDNGQSYRGKGDRRDGQRDGQRYGQRGIGVVF